MDDEAASAAKDRVVLVLTSDGVTGGATLPQTMELASEVPAPGALTDVASDRALIAELGTRDLTGCLSESPVPFSHGRVARDLGNGCESSDAHSAIASFSDAAELVEPGDAHNFGAIEYLVTQASEKIGTAGRHPGAIGAQLLERLFERLGSDIRERR
jgi:hypothetical protein